MLQKSKWDYELFKCFVRNRWKIGECCINILKFYQQAYELTSIRLFNVFYYEFLSFRLKETVDERNTWNMDMRKWKWEVFWKPFVVKKR